ncbi:hypothetical protein V490_00134 [Pseudogymnoascus sp. VKM F-3557]|nr:hypothetical protein V490_00134 [Pseudogymnoascus sp. VKM F-3557]
MDASIGTNEPDMRPIIAPVPEEQTYQSDANFSFKEGEGPERLQDTPEALKQHWVETLTALYGAPASSRLCDCFQASEKGSPRWDESTFIEHLKYVASMTGPERHNYYDPPLKGLHNLPSFSELFSRRYPRQRISKQEGDFGLCPRDWTNKLDEEKNLWVLTYHGDQLFPRGIIELFEGPTTLDCGMATELFKWFSLLLTVGASVLQEVMPFERGQFTLTQHWDIPMNEAGTAGNLLHQFYDPPRTKAANQLTSQTRIHTRTVFNFRTYHAKHPAGIARLENVTQIDEYFLIFDPTGSKNILSKSELDQRLMEQYNSPQSTADLEKLSLWGCMKDRNHPFFNNLSLADVSAAGRRCANHTFDKSSWKATEAQRKEDAEGLCLAFNFERLITCIRETMDARRRGVTDEDFWSRARRLKEEYSLSYSGQ